MTAATARCPTCRRTVHKDAASRSPFWPFCGERCHLIDLGRWLGEEYRIAEGPDGSAAAEGSPPSEDDSR